PPPRTNLTGTNFTDAHLQNTIFTNALITSTTDFAGANTTGAVGLPSPLPTSPPPPAPPSTGLDFSGQNLQNHNFAGANLVGANFSGANLQGAIFDGAALANANFSTPGHTTNLSGASFIGADLTNADFQGVNLQGANLDPPDTKGPIAVSSLTPQNDKRQPGARSGVQNVAPPPGTGSPAGHGYSGHPGSTTGVTAWQQAPHWQHSGIDGSAKTAGHTWNGQPHVGAFDRYTLPGNVTGKVGLTHTEPSLPQAGGPPAKTGGFTRYVISASTGNGFGNSKGVPGPQWLNQAGANGGTPHPRWLTQGSAANVSQTAQQSAGKSGGAVSQSGVPQGIAVAKEVVPQQVTAAAVATVPTPALQQITAAAKAATVSAVQQGGGAVNGAALPRWVTQGTANGGPAKGLPQTGAQPPTTSPSVSPKK
ncbi:MAG TPA: pentapeptide repeat-containing protein, partial [Stellaceae bacterium]